MVLRQVMLQHLRAVLEEAARKTSTSQMRRVCREPKAEAPRSEEMRKDGERSVSGSAQREQQDGSQHATILLGDEHDRVQRGKHGVGEWSVCGCPSGQASASWLTQSMKNTWL